MSDIPEYNAPLPHLASHPIFSGNVAILTGQNPKYPGSGNNDTLQNELQYHGYKFEPVKGQYQGTPEDSFLVKNPDPKVIAGIAKKLGQESIFIGNKGQHKLLYTNGENEGRYHAGTGTYGFHATQKPQDNYSHIPGLGYLRMNFDWDHTHPLENQNMPTQNTATTQTTQLNPDQASPAEVKKALGGLGKSLRGLLAKHEKAIEDLKAKEAKGVQKLSKNAQGNGGELPGNVYNNPGVMQSGPVNKAMLGSGPVPQTGAVGTMGKATLSEKGKLDEASKNASSTNKKPYKARGYGEFDSVAPGKAANSNAQAQSKAQSVEKSDLPGAGTGVTSPDAGDSNQSMKMSEKCPTCGNEKTEPMSGGKGGSSFLKCKECSRLFRGAGNKPSMKKSSEMTPESEGMGCQACGGDRVEHLGDLGSRSHFICKGCGMSFSHQKEEAPQSFNDSDLEPIAKSVYQAKCKHCGKEQEKQGAGRALEALTCSSCGKNGGLKKVKPTYSNSADLEKKGMSPGAVKALALKKGVVETTSKIPEPNHIADNHASKGVSYEKGKWNPNPRVGFLRGLVAKYNTATLKNFPSIEKKEIPQVEPATDEIDMPGTKTIKNVKPKLIETDGSGSPTTGPDLKKDGMDPGCTAGGDLQKAGIRLQNPPVGSSVSGHKVLPASTLPRTSQIPQVDRTAFLKGLIAKYGTKSVNKVSSPAGAYGIPKNLQGSSLVHGPAQPTMPKPNMVAKAEYRPNGPCPTCGSRYAGDYCKECRHPRLAEGLRSQVAEKDRKAAHSENKAKWEKEVNKAEMGGVPKAPSAMTVKAPTAAKVAAPGVKQSNPTAPKIGIKPPTTPKV